MLLSVLIAVAVFGICGSFHYWAMTRCMRLVARYKIAAGLKLLTGLYCAGVAHAVEAAIYGTGFGFLQAQGLGGFSKADGMSSMDIFYFSLVNYTSLGLGDIYPTGHLRLLAGVASLNGFLLISCSASFLFLLMSEHRSKPGSASE